LNELLILFGWLGLFGVTALGAMGSIVGCATAGQAAIGAMLETESGYGRFIGASVLPSSQIIYGIVVMLTLQREITAANAGALFGIGVATGIALLLSGLRQGQCCASAINAAKEKPEVFGIALGPAAIVEGFAVFVFVFALVLSANVPA
jgi:V/A-type H+-transporting ATPase subunit K